MVLVLLQDQNDNQVGSREPRSFDGAFCIGEHNKQPINSLFYIKPFIVKIGLQLKKIQLLKTDCRPYRWKMLLLLQCETGTGSFLIDLHILCRLIQLIFLSPLAKHYLRPLPLVGPADDVFSRLAAGGQKPVDRVYGPVNLIAPVLNV